MTVRYPSESASPPCSLASSVTRTRNPTDVTRDAETAEEHLGRSALDAPRKGSDALPPRPFVLLRPLALVRFDFDVFRRAELRADLRVDLRADDGEPRFLAMRDLRTLGTPVIVGPAAAHGEELTAARRCPGTWDHSTGITKLVINEGGTPGVPLDEASEVRSTVADGRDAVPHHEIAGAHTHASEHQAAFPDGRDAAHRRRCGGSAVRSTTQHAPRARSDRGPARSPGGPP